MESAIEQVPELIDERNVADSIIALLDAGVDLLKKDDFDIVDRNKLQVITKLSSIVSNGVIMVQQRTARQRTAIVQARFDSLGFGGSKPAKQITSSSKKK